MFAIVPSATASLSEERRSADMPPPNSEQLEKFKAAAMKLETDDDKARFDERIRKIVEHKPVEKPE